MKNKKNLLQGIKQTSGRIDDVLLPLILYSQVDQGTIVQPMFCRPPHHLFSRTQQESTTSLARPGAGRTEGEEAQKA